MTQALHSHSRLPEPLETSPTVGDIFKKYGERFRAQRRLHPRQHKVMYDIEHCRGPEFGTHWQGCDGCGYVIKEYNSCRNRHCPGCNNISRKKWVAARIKELLPVSYHHCVFTLPHEFNLLCSLNRRVMYDLLFESSSQTLLDFGNNPKRLGATIGFYGILHTWGGKMWPHPHVHYITTAGGINHKGQWVQPKYNGTFLFPVRALSTVFRAKFLTAVQKAYDKEQLKLPDALRHIYSSHDFAQWLYHEIPKTWVVFSKPPFSGPEEVVKYIGRYTHRTAISNNRIIAEKDGNVEFWFKNTKKKSRWEKTSLPVMTFIERFLYHVLPKHFHRIRYYGFLSNGQAKTNLETIRQDMAAGSLDEMIEKSPDNGMVCPVCGRGNMVTILIIDGWGNVFRNLPDKEDQVPALVDTT